MNKRILTTMTVVLFLLLVTTAQAATTLMQIGRSPFHKPPLTSVESFLTMVADKEAEVKKGFEKAGNSELFAPFMEQVNSVQIDTVEFEKGSHFEWMMFKKHGNGKVRVAKDVTWGAEKTFTGLKFDIDYDTNRYTFAVPLGCGNIALMGMRHIPVVAPAPPPVNKAPMCGMTVSSVRAFCGEIITVDASSSSDAEGDIEKMTIAFVDDQGAVVSEKVVDGGTLVADVEVPCGDTTLKVSVTDADGETATSEACTTTIEGLDRVRWLLDVGYYHQIDPAHHLFGRVGFEYKIDEQWGVLAMIGAAPHIDGIDGESAILIDVIGEYSFAEKWFVDLGLGGWLTDGDSDIDAEDSQIDVIAALGARVYGEPDDFNASLFVEVRSGIDEMDEIMDYGRFGVGVRFRF